MASASILIVARNAEKTIERAVVSALVQGDYSIVLVDDCSDDATVAVAKSVGGECLQVISVQKHTTLGAARQLGLESLSTAYCGLLDADDEMLPGRMDRLVDVLEAESSDAIFDEIELCDGATGERISTLRIPSFIEEYSLCRLFERNYLPGIGQMVFRVEVFQKIGYDVGVHGPEDTDIVLRALLAGVRISLYRESGYRMYHYTNSVSRKLDRQNDELKRVLRKHSYDQVENLYRSANFEEEVVFWGLYSLAIFRDDCAAAKSYLRKVESVAGEGSRILEVGGPLPMSEEWRLAFANGVCELLWGSASEASGRFRSILGDSPEVLNNLGVAEARLDRFDEANLLFKQALELSPRYLDAQINSKNPSSMSITRLPLRRQRSRNMY